MPRPRKYEEPASICVHVRLTATQRRDLEQVARENRTALANMIREAINVFIADYREGPAVFRDPKPGVALHP